MSFTGCEQKTKIQLPVPNIKPDYDGVISKLFTTYCDRLGASAPRSGSEDHRRLRDAFYSAVELFVDWIEANMDEGNVEQIIESIRVEMEKFHSGDGKSPPREHRKLWPLRLNLMAALAS